MRKPKRGGSTRSYSQLPKMSINASRQKVKLQELYMGQSYSSEERPDITNNAASMNYANLSQNDQIMEKLEYIHEENTLKADQFPQTLIQTLKFVTTIDTYSKIYGHLVVDENFSIIYADSQAKEIYEASLNSFYTHSLLDLILLQDRQKFVNYCNQIIMNSKWVEYLTYSRMTARKFQDCPELEHPNNMDYFFRYLKILSSQIIPVTLDFTQFQKYSELFWNRKYLSKCQNLKIKCFVFRTRYCKEFPDLSGYEFSQDPIIKKMQTAILKKRIKTGIKLEKVGLKFDVNKFISEEQPVSVDSVLQGLQAECKIKHQCRYKQTDSGYDRDTDIKPLLKKKSSIRKNKNSLKQCNEKKDQTLVKFEQQEADQKLLTQKNNQKVRQKRKNGRYQRNRKNRLMEDSIIVNKYQIKQTNVAKGQFQIRLINAQMKSDENSQKELEQNSQGSRVPIRILDSEKTKINQDLNHIMRQQISDQKQNKQNKIIFFNYQSDQYSDSTPQTRKHVKQQKYNIFEDLRNDDDYIDQFFN